MVDDYRKRNQVYESYQKWLVESIDDNMNATITGAELNNRLGYFSMFHLLVQMRNEHYASARPLKKDIECMRENLFCNGVDTLEMERIFPPSYNPEDGSEWEDGSDGSGGITDPNRPDGVDYMQVEGDGTKHPINRIR